MKPTSRREFFKSAGLIGITGGAAALLLQGGCPALPQLTPPQDNGQAGGDNAAGEPNAAGGQGDSGATSSAKWPFSYSKLDVEYVRKLGHKYFYEGDCCYGAFSGIVQALAEKVGAPFDAFPTDMMRYGKGGMYGYGTLCGACNGASAAVQLVTDEPTAAKVITELLNWYATTHLPTDKANEYAVNHEYLVDELKTDEALVQNKAGNVLCHISVSKWCQASGYASGSEQRKERCARLAGDVAAKAAELLNAVADETFQPTLFSLGEQDGCMQCHKPGLDFSGGNFTQGKMDCTTCHVDPLIKPHTW